MKVLHIIISVWAVCLACVSCSQADISQYVPSGSGQVKIMYKVAGSSMSRVETEPGWEDWNENKIIRIDLFVVDRETENIYKHIQVANLGITNANSYQDLNTDELTYAEATSGKYLFYMVANCSQLETVDIQTFTDLKNEMINLPLTCNEQQTLFVMDGEGTLTDNQTEHSADLSFDLARAMAKIRLTVLNENKNSIIDQCTFQLCHYVSTGTSVLAGSEAYGEDTNQSRTSMDEAQGVNNVLQYTQNGVSKVIFYSYPNDWFDEECLNAKGTFADADIYANDDLIDEEKQTYILLTANFDGIETEYKVPVNQQMDKQNDKVEFTKSDIEKLRDTYYRMKRNYIYDITVNLNGPEEWNVNFMVNAWNEKGNMDVIFGGED